MVEIDGLEFRYGSDGFGLRVPKFCVHSCEKVALVGPSGCGKTTLLNLLAGIVAPVSGRLLVADQDLSRLGDAARRVFRIISVGMVFQEFELLDYLNVRENILLPYLVNPAQRLTPEARARADRLAESLGLADLLTRRIARLSHGERQRVAIGRALVTEPRLVLADEPTGNLDPALKSRIVDLLCEHTAGQGATLVMATHDHSLLSRFDRAIDFSDPAESGIERIAPATSQRSFDS